MRGFFCVFLLLSLLDRKLSMTIILWTVGLFLKTSQICIKCIMLFKRKPCFLSIFFVMELESKNNICSSFSICNHNASSSISFQTFEITHKCKFVNLILYVLVLCLQTEPTLTACMLSVIHITEPTLTTCMLSVIHKQMSVVLWQVFVKPASNVHLNKIQYQPV